MQKAVVKQVSENVSSELGARLLAPTPGARAFLSTVCRQEKAEKEKVAPTAPKSAKQLLQDHKQLKNFVPKLGRGVAAGGDVCLDISPARNMQSSHISHF